MVLASLPETLSVVSLVLVNEGEKPRELFVTVLSIKKYTSRMEADIGAAAA